MNPLDGTKAVEEPRRHLERRVSRLATESKNDESGKIAGRIRANVREIHVESDQSPALVLAGSHEITIH